MKHKYLVMYHPVLKWGSPLPTLQPSKKFVSQATGVTQANIRKNGWVWCKVEIETPEATDSVQEVLRLNRLIRELVEERDERSGQLTPEELDRVRSGGVRNDVTSDGCQ